MEGMESRQEFSNTGHPRLSEFTKKGYGKALESHRAPDVLESKGLMVVNNLFINLNSSNHRWTDAH